MNLEIFNIPDPSGRLSKEKYLSNNYPDEYAYILGYSIINNIPIETPFKEKVYLCINRLKKIPNCNNPNCNNYVNFKNSTLGYNTYCSNKCMGSDPKMIKQKEEKSLAKFGTKTPGESNIIKEKTMLTNISKYGGKSPMSSKITQEKSKNTLLEKYGYENPNQVPGIIKKRIISFKNNIEQYKDSFKKTMNDRHGVDHPWKMESNRNKLFEKFYKDYTERINISIKDKPYRLISFKKVENIPNIFLYCNTCKEEFNIFPYQFYYRSNNKISICTKCNPISSSSSIKQDNLLKLIQENTYENILENYKNIIKPYEVDIYLPDLNIGFEFNGLYWHSTKFKDNNYHLKKYTLATDNNIRLFTIWEDDWIMKNDICKSFILNKLGKSNSIMGRKCIIKEISSKDSRKFLDENHLQGNCNSSIKLGLYYNDELVCLMCFSKLRIALNKGIANKDTEGIFELTRFCNKTYTNVVGGASKLLNYFIKNYNPTKIETYSDNMISDGGMYDKLGFEYSHTSKPSYWYNINGIKSHRYNWRKQKLVKMGYDSNKTEEEIMSELGYSRIYNAGNKKWILNIKK